jgi:hypothetical protein
MKDMFISPLDDDIVKGLYGDRNNIANTAALLKAARGASIFRILEEFNHKVS